MMDQEPPKPDHAANPGKQRSPRRSKKQQSLKDMVAEPPDLADIMDMLAELENQHDRAAAVILAAQVENTLRAAILSRMVLEEREEARLFGPDMPLGTFSAKIKIGFALGVYGPETRTDLDTIREIRNAFAHARKPIKFNTPEIAAACARLRSPKRVPPDGVDERPWPPENPRDQYNATARLLWTWLARCAAKYKLPPPGWCPSLI
jgi:hypothetical protein